MVVFRCHRRDTDSIEQNPCWEVSSSEAQPSPAQPSPRPHDRPVILLQIPMHRQTNWHNTSPPQSAMCHSRPSPCNSSILPLQCFNFRVLTLLLYSPLFSFSPRCLFSFFLFILLSIFLSLFLFLCFFLSLGLYVSMNIVPHFYVSMHEHMYVFDVCVTVRHWYNCTKPTRCNNNNLFVSLLLRRAFCRINLIITPTNALTLKHLKSLQHVSILRSSSGSYVVPC